MRSALTLVDTYHFPYGVVRTISRSSHAGDTGAEEGLPVPRLASAGTESTDGTVKETESRPA